MTILAESAELASDIDVERAQEAKARAEKRLAEAQPDTDLARAELALKRAVSRIRVASR